MIGSSNNTLVTVIIFSPNRENTYRAQQASLPASATREAIIAAQNELIQAIFDGLDEELGWPVDREAVRLILRDPKL